MKTYWESFLELYPWMDGTDTRKTLEAFWHYCNKDLETARDLCSKVRSESVITTHDMDEVDLANVRG